MSSTDKFVRERLAKATSRTELWADFIQENHVKNMAEVGVYRGDFAAAILQKCSSIEKYYLIDPWKHLDDWNKPANQENEKFEQFFRETKSRTDFAANRRIILRGMTTEIIDQISDNELDFAYIDGDHTLRGIAIDLIRVFPKIREGGWIGGDDFSRTIWQHPTTYEPTLVFPFAVYFAEAMRARIYALPGNQFLLEKLKSHKFDFIDLTGEYPPSNLGSQLDPRKILMIKIREILSFIVK